MAAVTAYIGARININFQDLYPDQVKKLKRDNVIRIYEEKACKGCDYLSIRPSEYCSPCPAMQKFVMHGKLRLGDDDYLTLPVGYKDELEEIIPNIKFVYKTKLTPFKHNITFNWDVLRPLQKKAVKALMQKERGILRAPPRSGKTILASATSIYLGYKTFIIASQHDWLQGFYKALMGENGEPSIFVNAPEGSIGFAKKLADFKKYDICLITYQTLMHNDKLLQQVKNMGTTVIIDEVQFAAGTEYAKVIGSLSARYMFGLSGTPFRKDGKEVLFNKLINKIVHKVNTETLTPTFVVVQSPFSSKPVKSSRWDLIVKRIEDDDDRAEFIAQHAIRDAQRGHTVLIPMSSISGIDKVTNAINRLMGKRVAVKFTGNQSKAERDAIVTRASAGKIRIIVGTLRLLSVGINIPRASMLYEVALSSNVYNAEQRIARVLTPMEGKPTPTVKVFMDDYDVRRACFSNEWFHYTLPKCKPIISEKALQYLTAWMKSKTSSSRSLYE